MTDFRPCLLVPCYNHGEQLGPTLARLRATGLPCLLIDDGSDAATARQLDRIAAEQPWITLARLPRNGGKGAAVMHGFQLAAAQGYSHALQVDADGQHDIDDVPKLLALAQAEPAALVSGWPQFGADMPASRRYGRELTHFWVRVETASRAIKDSMCGFRVYPLAPTLALLARRRIGTRMDFDIDVMVKLYWAGTPVRFLPTQVRYPVDGLSHFRLWRDNVKITWLHIRLVLEMPLHLPALLRRDYLCWRSHWSQREERGSWWALRIVLGCFRLLGRRGLQLLLHPIIAYYFCTSRSARRASRDYLQRLHRAGALTEAPGLRTSYRHFLAFGQALADRLACWAGALKRDELVFHDYPQLRQQIDQRRGAMVLTAHIGSVEVIRALLRQNLQVPLKLNILVFTRHAAHFNRLLQEVNPQQTLELIQIDELNPASALALQQKIEAGEWLVIGADRTSPSAPERVVSASFLGAPAPLPQGPLILAALLKCPVKTLFCLREADGYHVYFDDFAERIELPRRARREALAAYAQRFADQLEQRVRKAPLQWFNFYDFWRQPDNSGSTPK